MKFPALFALLILAAVVDARAVEVNLVEEAPVKVTVLPGNTFLVDFGRVAFGNLEFRLGASAGGPQNVKVHFGEAMADGRINRQPPGTVRYAVADVAVKGQSSLVVAPPADARNTKQPAAVLTPVEWGVVLPFRWVEIEGWTGELRPEQIRRRAAFARGWRDDAAAFQSSDDLLNRIWELCRYSIKATTFAGVYVDGDRERIPYEADAYLNQLSQYYVEGSVQMARDTFDRLMAQPTWPTEWATHLIFMAHADWMQTGDAAWLAPRYAALKTKLRLDRARADGLVVSPLDQVKNDLVDWPMAERDGFEFKPVNTVINAFHLRALRLMVELARAVGAVEDAGDYDARETAGRAAFQRNLFDPARGLYRDGEETEHASLHASLFPLAFGLVPPEQRAGVIEWLGKRGMACSVYAAQYLLEGLWTNDADDLALGLITAPNDRSWRHMVESGTTITWEAWDQRFKPNQDWNHAWGAAPANLLPRFVLGAELLSPGWTRACVRPHPGTLREADGKIPTPLGPLLVRWTNGDTFKLSLTLPPGMSARVQLPATAGATGVFLDDRPASARRAGRWWILDEDVRGSVSIEAR